MAGRWLGERVTLPPYIEQRMRETAAVWQRCPGCRARWFGQRKACPERLRASAASRGGVERDPSVCMACDPTLEQIQPGVYRTKKELRP